MKGKYLQSYLRNDPHRNDTRFHWWFTSSGSGKGLVPSGNKQLTKPMLTKIFTAKWRHKTTNDLKNLPI